MRKTARLKFGAMSAAEHQPDPIDARADLAYGFLESHRRVEELEEAELEVLPSEKTFRKRIAKTERRAKEFLYGMGSGGALLVGGTAALILDPASIIFGFLGVGAEVVGMVGLGTSTLGLLNQQRKRQSLLNDFRDSEPDRAELAEQKSKKRELGVVEWDRNFFALTLESGSTDVKLVESTAKQIVEHAQVTGRVASGRPKFDWRLDPYSRTGKKQLFKQIKLLNRLWRFRQAAEDGSDLMESLSKTELTFLSKSKLAPKMLDDWRNHG